MRVGDDGFDEDGIVWFSAGDAESAGNGWVGAVVSRDGAAHRVNEHFSDTTGS